ncbi:MAG: SDR family NAD(P)-dependent oxidoreductase [Chitinophagaceae bacterium]|nr:MAG: SDR family NAD(P)-dependent oxidoreductase [Chitinophagaceae bacterium]
MATAIVTGISGNLGKATADKLLASGYKVAGSYSSKRPVPYDGTPGCSLFQADLTDEKSALGFVTDASATLGYIDVAVLTVGGFAMADLAAADTAAVEKMLLLNFYTAYNVARPVFDIMKKQGRGRIFLVGSLAGETPSGNRYAIPYALAKSLVGELASILNAEAGDKPIVTSLVIPSTIDTMDNRRSMPDADTSTWVSPETIAEVIEWYASPAAARLRQPVINITGKSV